MVRIGFKALFDNRKIENLDGLSDWKLESQVEEYTLFEANSKAIVPVQGLGNSFGNVYQVLRNFEDGVLENNSVVRSRYRLGEKGIEIKVHLENDSDSFRVNQDNASDAISCLESIMKDVSPECVKEKHYPKSHGFDFKKIVISGKSDFSCKKNSKCYNDGVSIEISFAYSAIQ